MENVNTRELEQQIFDKEEIRVVIRAQKDTTFKGYPYSKKAAVNTSITDWAATRLKPLVGEHEVEVIDGSGRSPHGLTHIEKVRRSYIEK